MDTYIVNTHRTNGIFAPLFISKKIKQLLLILIFVIGYYLTFNFHQIKYLKKKFELKKPITLQLSLLKFNVENNETSLLFSNRIYKNRLSIFENKNGNNSSFNKNISINNYREYNNSKKKSKISNDSTIFKNLKYIKIIKNIANNRNKDTTPVRNKTRKLINETQNRKDNSTVQVNAKRKSRVAEECQKMNIIQDNVTEETWGRSECPSAVSGKGYKECIMPRHFPLARSSSTMTCLINKVASTSVALLFLENDGQVTPSLNDSSPHAVISSIVAERKEEFAFAKKNFFKFLIVRDPFERLLSAYVDKVINSKHWSLLELRGDIMNFIIEHNGYLTGDIVKVDSSLFKKKSDETINTTSNYRDSYLPSFQEFLVYILNSNHEGEGFESHWASYWRWCAPCSMKYDFIAKLDSTHPDLEFIWNRMGIQDKEKIPWLNKTSRKRREMEEKKKLHYSLLSLKSIADVYKKYYLDFILFDYDIRDVLIKGLHCTNGDCEKIMKKYFFS